MAGSFSYFVNQPAFGVRGSAANLGKLAFNHKGRGARMQCINLSGTRYAHKTGGSPRGTKGSNPAPSSAESATNLVAAGGVARGWDPEFESALLQQRVHCEPSLVFFTIRPR